MESHEAYSTPIPFEHNGRAEMLVAGGDCITGHSVKNGEEYWRWGTWNPQKIQHRSDGALVVLAEFLVFDPERIDADSLEKALPSFFLSLALFETLFD